MLSYLLDTDICSYAIKHKTPKLLAKIERSILREESAISVVTRAELLYGLALVPEAISLKKAVLAFLEVIPCLAWPIHAAQPYANLRSQQKLGGTPIGYMDTLIAAHTLAEKLILVTHNTKHFERIEGLKMQDWALG